MNIAGIGTINRCGRGLEALRGVLKGEAELRSTEQVSADLRDGLKSAGLLKSIRRADHFSRMALLAAHDAVVDSGLPAAEVASSLGIVLATGLGPHVSTMKFLDGIIDFGELGVSPLVFSHTVHNAAASYVASMMGSNGATVTVTQFMLSWHHALLQARVWLEAGRYSHVLVGAVEESGQVLNDVLHCKVCTSRHANEEGPPVLDEYGEGSVFFLLTGKDIPGPYAMFDSIGRGSVTEWGSSDLMIASPDFLQEVGDPSRDIASAPKEDLDYTALFGRMMTGNAFNCMIAALVIGDHTVYVRPPYTKELEPERVCPEVIAALCCIQHSRRGEPSVVRLREHDRWR